MSHIHRLGLPTIDKTHRTASGGLQSEAETSVAAFRDLASSLLSLIMLTHTAELDGLLCKALQALNCTLPFSSAWWGELSASGGAGRRARIWMHDHIGLSNSFAEHLNQITTLREFGAMSMSQPGVVVWRNDHPSVEQSDSECGRFALQHGLRHAMAITLDLPFSGLHFVVVLYRGPDRPGFTALEAARFEAYATHLVHLWRDRLMRVLVPLPAWEARVLADTDGKLLYLGRRVALAMGRAYPHWSGPRLPDDLVSAATEGKRVVSVGTAERLVVKSRPDLISVALQDGRARAPLPRREMNAAMLYAKGHTSKAVAEMLGLSRATVRTYLQGAYGHLGVQNKVELVAALGTLDAV
ncbi:MAG: response regulator transcription factor [Burkholderiaceae bacterium]|nr:response regulator transcription factor [Burkholderiaceae bacterium]